MKAPPDIQLATLLWFLKEAMRRDTYIQKWAECAPEEIVAAAVEYQPIQRAEDGIAVLVSQMPCLALNVQQATPMRDGARWGRELTANLWYLFKSQQAEGLEIHGFEKNERWKSLIAWRLNYWLKKQKIYSLAAGSSGPTIDLQSLSKIKTLGVDLIEWLDMGPLQGLKLTLSIKHMWSPYEEVAPSTFDLLDFSIYTFDSAAPTTPELLVEADIDQSDN